MRNGRLGQFYTLFDIGGAQARFLVD